MQQVDSKEMIILKEIGGLTMLFQIVDNFERLQSPTIKSRKEGQYEGDENVWKSRGSLRQPPHWA